MAVARLRVQNRRSQIRALSSTPSISCGLGGRSESRVGGAETATIKRQAGEILTRCVAGPVCSHYASLRQGQRPIAGSGPNALLSAVKGGRATLTICRAVAVMGREKRALGHEGRSIRCRLGGGAKVVRRGGGLMPTSQAQVSASSANSAASYGGAAPVTVTIFIASSRCGTAARRQALILRPVNYCYFRSGNEAGVVRVKAAVCW